MNWKTGLTIVALSATTAIASVWGYGKFVERQNAGIQEQGKLPVNYAGFYGTNNNKAAGAVDFTAAATSATPAVVHIKTRTKAKQVASNQQRQRNPFSDSVTLFYRRGILNSGMLSDLSIVRARKW